MKDIVLIGAGGFAREVAWLIEENNKVKSEWNILGYIAEGKGHIGKYSILGGDDWLIDYPEEIYAVCCIGNSKLREKVIKKVSQNPNIVFPNIISYDAKVSDTVIFGKGCVVCSGTIMTVDINVGDFFICNLGCTVGHDTQLSDFVTVYPGVNISGNVTIGKGTEVGTGTSIIQGINIGNYSTIGASAAVAKNIPDKCTAVGVPAKVIKMEE